MLNLLFKHCLIYIKEIEANEKKQEGKQSLEPITDESFDNIKEAIKKLSVEQIFTVLNSDKFQEFLCNFILCRIDYKYNKKDKVFYYNYCEEYKEEKTPALLGYIRDFKIKREIKGQKANFELRDKCILGKINEETTIDEIIKALEETGNVT